MDIEIDKPHTRIDTFEINESSRKDKKGTKLQQYLEIIEYKARPEFLNKYLKTPSLLRLKNVGYLCGMDYASKDIYYFEEYVSRYDHSLTVALLTWRYTKSRKATLAGLFHDIATPCFSHVIDYMNKDYENQESTEEYTEDILKEDKYLQECLKQDGISLQDIADFKRYSIVDSDRPKLCTDRLDGLILTALFWTKTITIPEVEEIVNHTNIFLNEEGNEEIGFTTKESAELALKTSETIDIFCHSKEDNYMMELLASLTKDAIEKGYITYHDLYTLNEKQLMNILEHCKDKKINEKLNLFKEIKKEDIPEINLANVKMRDLNPLVNGKRLKY